MKFNKQNLFFTSDFHLEHKNVIKFDNRPFKDVDEMSETLINNWNNKISSDDVVFYLGDLYYKGSVSKVKNIVNQLNGTIYFITGNHDREKYLKKMDRFEEIIPYKEIWVADKNPDTNKDFFQHVCMFHYPILSWNRHHYKSFHLHGHCHQSMKGSDYYQRNVIDVGCNGHNYTPLSYNDVKELMKEKSVINVDHHD